MKITLVYPCLILELGIFIECRDVPSKVASVKHRPDRGSRNVTVNTALTPSGTIGTAVSGVGTALYRIL